MKTVIKKLTMPFVMAALAVLTVATAGAATSTTLVITPSSPVYDSNNVVGVSGDAAPGYQYGSLASNGGAKTDMYFTPEALFGREVTLGEVASISYWTKKGSTHTVDTADWYLAIYTKKYPDQTISFYGARIEAEPYFSINLSDPANIWNQWTTDGATNQLRFYESTYGYFGSYTDPNFASFVAGNSLSGTHGPSVPYASQPILYFSIQTGSAWAAGFTGQLDGLSISLTDGSVANVNFEPYPVATDIGSCMKDGWQGLFRSDGSPFKNQGDCIQFVNTGK